MKKVTGLALALFIPALCFQTALAQEDKAALVPLPSLDDFSRGEDGWSFGLGLGVEYESAYEGSDEFGFEAQPAGAVQWRSGDNIFYFAGEALGWRGLRDDKWLLEATLGFDEGREESDSDEGHLDGLGTTDEGVELVLQARRAFDADWRYWLDGRVVAGENGSLGIFGVGRRFGERTDGSGSEFSVVAVFHDSDLANEQFGVNSMQAAASGLDETYLSGGFRSIGAHYNYRNYINDNWQIFGEVLYERYSSDITDSPVARNDYEAEVGIGFIYVF
ncbi:MipA/OmpV family protein [Pseudidiomarina halophila]|uniref:MipA/OmpV family protein n=1 Tax=Pseudidiomarina halophila TaxID=1449799 RepID=A0A432XZT5_9GAMM|nr:MipA/OmpV family protein [Pseudidiomarina halophila]RUO54230.1 MipA/OmpV family protein [Pseudidiomarina halophila]